MSAALGADGSAWLPTLSGPVVLVAMSSPGGVAASAADFQVSGIPGRLPLTRSGAALLVRGQGLAGGGHAEPGVPGDHRDRCPGGLGRQRGQDGHCRAAARRRGTGAGAGSGVASVALRAAPGTGFVACVMVMTPFSFLRRDSRFRSPAPVFPVDDCSAPDMRSSGSTATPVSVFNLSRRKRKMTDFLGLTWRDTSGTRSGREFPGRRGKLNSVFPRPGCCGFPALAAFACRVYLDYAIQRASQHSARQARDGTGRWPTGTSAARFLAQGQTTRPRGGDPPGRWRCWWRRGRHGQPAPPRPRGLGNGWPYRMAAACGHRAGNATRTCKSRTQTSANKRA